MCAVGRTDVQRDAIGPQALGGAPAAKRGRTTPCASTLRPRIPVRNRLRSGCGRRCRPVSALDASANGVTSAREREEKGGRAGSRPLAVSAASGAPGWCVAGRMCHNSPPWRAEPDEVTRSDRLNPNSAPSIPHGTGPDGNLHLAVPRSDLIRRSMVGGSHRPTATSPAPALRPPQLGLDGPTEQGGIKVRNDACKAPTVQPDELSLQRGGPAQHGLVVPEPHPHLALLDVDLKSPGKRARLRNPGVLSSSSACDADAR